MQLLNVAFSSGQGNKGGDDKSVSFLVSRLFYPDVAFNFALFISSAPFSFSHLCCWFLTRLLSSINSAQMQKENYENKIFTCDICFFVHAYTSVKLLFFYNVTNFHSFHAAFYIFIAPLYYMILCKKRRNFHLFLPPNSCTHTFQCAPPSRNSLVNNNAERVRLSTCNCTCDKCKTPFCTQHPRARTYIHFHENDEGTRDTHRSTPFRAVASVTFVVFF